MPLKKCSKCHQIKKTTEFHKNSSRKDGFCHYCANCSNIRKRQAYKINMKNDPNFNKKREQKRLALNPDYYKEKYERELLCNPDLNKETYWKRIERNPEHCKDDYEKNRLISIECSKNYKKGNTCKKNT